MDVTFFLASLALICIILIPGAQPLFKSNLKKAKMFYKKKFGKGKLNYLGHDESEYPGTNADYRNVNRQKWQEYYDCLGDFRLNLGYSKSVIPLAIEAIEGNYVRFECKMCLSPKTIQKTESVEWKWAAPKSKFMETVELTENMFVSGDKSLQIYNLQQEHAGQYMCILGNSLTTPYFLTVSSSTSDMRKVHSKFARTGPYPNPPENIEHNLILTTDWGPWSSCSKCGKIGRRYRLGYCMVSIQTVKRAQRNIETIKQSEFELLRIFRNGIPCRSHILPKSIKNLPQVKNRKNEVMLGYCKKICQDELVFEVKDKFGNVIEKANNSAGIYSLAQGLPPIEPRIERRLQYEEMNTDVMLKCPGNLNSDAPIEWQLASKIIVPELITKQSNGRMYISLMDKLHINKAKISDSNIYSCWQHNELAGTLRLVVEKRFKMTFNHHIMLFGLIIILSTFLFVFMKAFLGRKFAKTS